MHIPKAVQTWLQENKAGEAASARPVSGGSINNGLRIETNTGQLFFMKTNPRVPADMFACEAEALQELTKPDGPRFPKAFLHGPDFLLMEYMHQAPHKPDYWETLGRKLAILHNYQSPQFGFWRDNYIGSSLQPNPMEEDGFLFYGEHRLGFQAGMAYRNGLLTPAETRQVNLLAQRLAEFIPEQPAALLHGDLWSGNIIADDAGEPVLIDPAAYYGWPETDLAMTVLFGSPPEKFFRAYQEVRPLPSGLYDRFPIYNLYHLLNHLNLFGRSYYSQVITILRRFA